MAATTEQKQSFPSADWLRHFQESNQGCPLEQLRRRWPYRPKKQTGRSFEGELLAAVGCGRYHIIALTLWSRHNQCYGLLLPADNQVALYRRLQQGVQPGDLDGYVWQVARLFSERGYWPCLSTFQEAVAVTTHWSVSPPQGLTHRPLSSDLIERGIDVNRDELPATDEVGANPVVTPAVADFLKQVWPHLDGGWTALSRVQLAGRLGCDKGYITQLLARATSAGALRMTGERYHARYGRGGSVVTVACRGRVLEQIDLGQYE